ncbi:MAG: hypothetical protein VYD78_06325 [Gemmatimonadota bacterium]|nr:hypothetical protein [Gemmatimonadota bacterium]
MSSSESDREAVSPDVAIARLEEAITSILQEMQSLHDESSRMDAQGQELEGLFRGVALGKGGPREMMDRLRILEEENQDLRARLDMGKEGIGKLLTRIRFLEEQR